MTETASNAQNMFGDKLYQKRAQNALPILVRQASSRQPIIYGALANELNMPNPRNLNHVLGSVGNTLLELSNQSGLGNIPHIQSLVINQTSRLPGDGFNGFLARRHKEYQELSRRQKREYLESYWHEIYAYPYWEDVLKACNLNPIRRDEAKLIDLAKNGRSGGGGEGEQHRVLKEYIANNPTALGFELNLPGGTTEASLPSGDKIDVLFTSKKRWLAVEIKSAISNEVDLLRGLFQCVKYNAVLLAERGYKGDQYSVECVLVVGRPFPAKLKSLQNSLGVQVIEVFL